MQVKRLWLVTALLAAVSCRGSDEKPRGGDDPVPPPPPAVERVNLPSNLFTLANETIAVRACCRKGDRLNDVTIPFPELVKLDSIDRPIEEIFLVDLDTKTPEILSARRTPDGVVANLVGGRTYLVVPVIDFFVPNYRALCRFMVLDGLLPSFDRLLDSLCAVILCAPDFFEARDLYTREEFRDLKEFEQVLRFEEEGLVVGGFGGLDGLASSNDLCERCTGFGRPGQIYPDVECLLMPPPRLQAWGGTVINMIPRAQSGESNQDAEPHLTIDRVDADCMVGTAFTPSATGGALAPIYVTQDGGQTWTLNHVVDSNGFAGTGDISVDSGDGPGETYAGILRAPGNLDMRVFRTDDAKDPAAMTEQLQELSRDQPWTDVRPQPADDVIYVGNNDLGGTSPRTATVDVSTDSGSTYTSVVVEPRGTGSAGQDAPSVRTAIATTGRVYAAYIGWRSLSGTGPFDLTGDIVVCRDDDGDPTTNAFADLIDGGDGLAGVRVDTGRTFRFDGSGVLGQNRIGSTLALAVDPTDDDIVYIAWCEQGASSDSEAHVRRSDDGGATWSPDIRVIPDCVNLGLAVNEQGALGFLRQTHITNSAGSRWVTVVEVFESLASGSNVSSSVVLATTPSNAPTPTFQPYLGDYAHILAHGSDFRGVFSANNTPRLANFPQGVQYQRPADFTAIQLEDTGGNAVPVSIDPFFFHVRFE